MKRLIELLIDWWQTPSPTWMQRASIRLVPAMVVAGAFLVGGTGAYLAPYIGSHETWGSLRPFDPRDTDSFAILRFIVGGSLGAGAVIGWCRLNLGK